MTYIADILLPESEKLNLRDGDLSTLESWLWKAACSIRGEVDGLLQEMQQTIKEREIAVTQLETKLADLNQRTESREKLMKDLEEKRLSQEVIQDILGTFEDTERRTSRQNWYFFIAGVLLSIPVGFLINMASTSMGF